MARIVPDQEPLGAPQVVSNGRAGQPGGGPERQGIVASTNTAATNGETSEALPIEPLLVTVEEAARLLSLGRSMVYELIGQGEILSVRIGTARRHPLAALRAWVAKRTSRDGER